MKLIKPPKWLKVAAEWLAVVASVRLLWMVIAGGGLVAGAGLTSLYLNAPVTVTSAYQGECAEAIAKLILAARRVEPKGSHFFTLGEAYRTPAAAAANGFAESNHTRRTAIDLNLYINGVYQTDSAAHAPLGKIWKQIGVDMKLATAWGGDFTKPDGNHYSCQVGNIK